MRPHQELSKTCRRPIRPGSSGEGTIIGGAFWIWPLGQPNQRRDNWLRQPADRPYMGANLSFVDGHVAAQRWRWPKRIGGPGIRTVRCPWGWSSAFVDKSHE